MPIAKPAFSCAPMWAAVAALLLVMAPVAGQARVVAAEAEYQAGVLRVWGRTARAGQYVTLNSAWIRRSNRLRQFRFQQMRLPRACRARLKSEGQSLTIPIRGCRH